MITPGGTTPSAKPRPIPPSREEASPRGQVPSTRTPDPWEQARKPSRQWEIGNRRSLKTSMTSSKTRKQALTTATRSSTGIWFPGKRP
eukprot:4065050-Heterocapsa_arctica.AAC.1